MGAIAGNARNGALDTLRGLAILLVIADHCGVPLPTILDYFEVPAFFIISGMLFRLKGTLQSFVADRFRRFVIPYILFNLLFLLFFWEPCSLPEGMHGVAWALVFSANSPLWFFKALLWVQLLALPLWLTGTLTTWRRTAITLLCSAVAALLFAALISSASLPEWALATGLPQAILTLPLFLAGRLIILHSPPSTRFDAPVGILLLLLCFLLWDGHIHLYKADVGNLAIYLPYSLTLFAGAYLLVRCIGSIPPLAFTGRLSLQLFCLHAIIIQAMRLLLPDPTPWLLLLTVTPITLLLAHLFSLLRS